MSPPPLPWLLTDEAAAVLADAVVTTGGPAELAALRKRLGGDLNATARAAAVFEQLDLRRRGSKKFLHAERMFFTRKALEQATDEWVARYKAQRFDGADRVVDACCGVGGDMAGFTDTATRLLGIDTDPDLAAYARHNASVYGVDAEVDTTTLDAQNLPECDAWHADPDRRVTGRRTTQPESHEPSLTTLAAWRERTGDAAIKLAPAARLPADWEETCELEWISRGGECRQLVAWAGRLARNPGRRRATRVAPQGEVASLVGAPGRTAPVAATLDAWVHDLDPAVLAADLAGAVAERHGLQIAAPRVAYFTSGLPVDDRLVSSFRVAEVMPLSRKRLAGWLAARGVGTLEIKCRGVEVRPEALRRELKPRGDAAMTLLVFPDAKGKTTVVIAERPSGTPSNASLQLNC